MWRSVSVGVPALVLAAVGLLHPMVLSADTSRVWTALHLVLIPVFPLLGVSLWMLLRGESGPAAAVARAAAFVYGCFYGALDTINGVAVGTLVSHPSAAAAAGQQQVLRPVLDVGNQLAWVGSSAFLVGATVTSILVVRRCGRSAVPGAALTVVAALSFLDSHIYWPRGVLTMLVLAVGLVLMQRQISINSPGANDVPATRLP